MKNVDVIYFQYNLRRVVREVLTEKEMSKKDLGR